MGEEVILTFLLSTNQAGMIIGPTIMSSWKGFENNAKGIAFSMFFFHIGFFIIVFVPIGNFLVIAVEFVIIGFMLPVMAVSSEIIWSNIVPRELLERVYAVRRTVSQFTFPIAVLLGGFFVEVLGLVFVLATSAMFGMFLLGYLWFFTPMSNVEQTLRENLGINSGSESLPTQS